MTPALVAIDGLVVRAGGRTVLTVDHLDLRAGQTVAVLGRNGAGKSMLLRTLVGAQAPAAGRVTVLGEPMRPAGPGGTTALRRRIGYLPQLPPVPGQMPLTVREVAAIGRTGLRGLLRPLTRRDWAVVDQCLAQLGLADLADRPFARLSGGEQRRAVLARVLAQQPHLIVLDEPAAHLDLAGREQVVAALERLAREAGSPLLLACHELEAIPPGCGRVVLLERGRVLADGPPDPVLTGPAMARLLGPGLRVLPLAGRYAAVPGGEETGHA